MGFDWKMFAADFLTEVTEDIEERQTEAKDYLKEQKAAADRNAQLINQRDQKAKAAAQYGKMAENLGASPAQIRTAMASGMTGVADLYKKLQEVANSKGVKRLGVDDIEAVISMPNIPTVNESLADMSLEDFAKRTYGVTPIATTKPEEKDYSMLASMFGYDSKQRAEKKLQETEYMGGLSVADINALSRQSEYQSLIPGATMTFTEIDYFTPDEALTFSTKLSKAMSDATDGDDAEAYIKAKVRAAGADPKARADADKKARAFLKAKAAKPLIEYFADTYQHGGFFDNRLVIKQIEDTMGSPFLNDLMEVYGLETETDETSEETPSSTNNIIEEPTITIEETLRKEPEITEEEDPTLKAAPSLSDEGKAIVEQALSGQLIKGYTSEYTRDQWDNMSRKERKERNLPETRLGIVGFDFKEDIDEMLEKPLNNLNIKRNLDNDKEYKIKIKGRGVFTVTGEQLASMDDSAFTMPYKPAIEIYEYEEGEEKARKLTTRILERYQVGE
jgi:hypothetical protein